MERRSAVIAIAVAGAMAVGMVSCATRCVARRAGEEPAREERAATEEEVAATRWRTPEPDSLADELRTRAWEATDGTGATLSVRGGILVERSASGDVAVTSFEVASESGDVVSVRCVGPEGATFENELRVTREGGAMTVSSGAFRLCGTYREAGRGGTVRIDGVPEAYLSLVGDWQGFAHGVEAFCALWVPDAGVATFFPEVSLDTASGHVTATLACDDPAATMVSVTWDGTTFEVSCDGR
jgi:hypothetical protein